MERCFHHKLDVQWCLGKQPNAELQAVPVQAGLDTGPSAFKVF